MLRRVLVTISGCDDGTQVEMLGSERLIYWLHQLSHGSYRAAKSDCQPVIDFEVIGERENPYV